jgi:hypothetical protein
MCRGFKNQNGSDAVDFDMNLWTLLKPSLFHPTLLNLRGEVRGPALHKHIIASKHASKLSKKDNPWSS